VSYPSFKIFSILFGVLYMVCFYMEWALFWFYPQTMRFYLRATPQDGAAIQWYGWMATAGLASAAIAFVVPKTLADRLGDTWVWFVPAAAIVGMLIFESRWFR
jgi:hypothetical protein